MTIGQGEGHNGETDKDMTEGELEGHSQEKKKGRTAGGGSIKDTQE
jgi:hypothetical protein